MNKHCIIFIHGFFGGSESFKNTNKIFFDYYFNDKVKEKYDFDYKFTYYSKSDYFNLKKHMLLFRYMPLFRKFISQGYNNSIDSISKSLYSKYREKIYDGYKTVSFIGHSMGGIIAKKTVLDMMKEDIKFQGKYISLATPHKGVKINSLIKKLNVQAVEIDQNSDLINSLSEGWTKYKNKISRQYYYGNSDPVIGSDVAFPDDLDEHKLFMQNEDHDTISKPYTKDSVLMKALNKFLMRP